MKKNILIAFLFLSVCLSQFLTGCNNMQADVNMDFYWQAHRGGGLHDAPDNSIAALLYTWKLGGIPEADIRTTSDSVIICLHDGTLARTSNAPDDIKDVPVSELSFDQVQKYDIGVTFSQDYKGEFVPSLEQVFKLMQNHSDRQLYLDIKDVDLQQLGDMMNQYKVCSQILVCSPRQDDCKTLKAVADGVRSMLWMGGSAEEIKSKFYAVQKSGFEGLNQVQLHLNDIEEPGAWRYQLDAEFVKKALEITRAAEIDLEVFPFHFEEKDVYTLFDIGIRWYATDEPGRFSQAIENWKNSL